MRSSLLRQPGSARSILRSPSSSIPLSQAIGLRFRGEEVVGGDAAGATAAAEAVGGGVAGFGAGFGDSEESLREVQPGSAG